MHIETLIITYIWLCVCLIVFDSYWVLWMVYDNKHHMQQGNKLKDKIYEQIVKIARRKEVDNSHKEYIIKKLTKIKYLMAFHETLILFEKDGEEQLENYIMSIRPLFADLALKYKHKNVMEKAYFAYVTSNHKICQDKETASMINTLITFMLEDSIYCRENVMRALYSSGDVSSVIRGIKLLDNKKVYYHTKLLTDGLLTFQGSHKDLSQALWENFDYFSISFRVSIINYYRFTTGDFSQELFSILRVDKTDAEIKYAVIRYFGRYTHEPVRDILIEFLEMTGKDKWEFQAIAALALISYPSQKAIDALKKALSISNWYVRLNAAKSLSSMNIADEEAADVLNGDDRFAREILQYHMHRNDMPKSQNPEVIGIQ